MTPQDTETLRRALPTAEQVAEIVTGLRDPNDTFLRYSGLAADWLEALFADRAPLLARVEALEGALKPFAETAAVICGAKAKDDDCWAGQRPAKCLTFGDFRRVLAALNHTAPEA